MKCPHCGQQHAQQVRFCPLTGNQIFSYECPRCGEVVFVEAAFCTNCGLALLEPQPPAPPPQAPPSQAPFTAGQPAPGAPPPYAPPIPRQGMPVLSGKLLGLALFFGLLLIGAGGYLIFLGITSTNPLARPPTAQPPFAAGSATPLPSGSAPAPTQHLTLTAMAGLVSTDEPTPTPAAARTVSPTATRTTAPTRPQACTSIGQTWTREIDGMQMVCVPAGAFTIGQPSCGYTGCEKEVNGGSVDLPAFWIDRSEVTNTMYQRFVEETGFRSGAEKSGASAVYGITTAVYGADWRHPQGPSSSITYLGDHPVVQLNWYAANAYCKWAGMQLPSEAQWEKAARGTDGRLFPWGNSMPLGSLLNAADISLSVPWARRDQDDGYRTTSPVGSYPAGASPYGVLDLSGNAWEWTRSLYRDYPYRINDGRELSADPDSTDLVTLRGGCWYDDYGSVRATLRYGGKADQSTDGTGFRCAAP